MMMTVAYLYYKLTNEPKGELKTTLFKSRLITAIFYGCPNFLIFTVHLWAASWQNQQNGMCAQWRLRSEWASVQSDQSLRCALNG